MNSDANIFHLYFQIDDVNLQNGMDFTMDMFRHLVPNMSVEKLQEKVVEINQIYRVKHLVT